MGQNKTERITPVYDKIYTIVAAFIKAVSSFAGRKKMNELRTGRLSL